DGRGRLVEVVVAPALASATEEIGPLVTEAVRDAQEKASALAAHEFGRAAEELNLPIPPETLRGLLGGAS
ncbi:MAG: YbaB/EbfC family nucleoid-associated protein, partial [Planctomycetota bacterium]|nr:YbaB/EbfC family nucleoid-associated protein [Planctomycetota bacterium]